MLILYRLSAPSMASNSESPTVFAEISGSLCKTFNEFFNVANTYVRACLLEVIFAGSPRVDDNDLFVLT